MACGDRNRVDPKTKAMGDKAALWLGRFVRIRVVAFESIEDSTRSLRASCFTAFFSTCLVEEGIPDPASNSKVARHRAATALIEDDMRVDLRAVLAHTHRQDVSTADPRFKRTDQ